MLGKNFVYTTSWPYWEKKGGVVKPLFFTRKLWKVFLKNTKAVTCTRKSRDSLKTLTDKVIYVPHSIDLNIFKPMKKKNKKIKALYIGRLVKEKGIKYILKLAEDFKNVEFIFVGEGYMKKDIEEKNLNVKQIDFIIEKNKLVELYNQADIFILPSYAEGNWEEFFGITLVEAMACKTSLIATDSVGPSEIVENGKNGFLIKQKNYSELKKVFVKLLKDAKLRDKMASYGLNKSKDYDINKNSEILHSLMFDKL